MRTPKRILERRRSVRIEEALPFKIGHQGYELEARTVNISAHGAWCVVEKDVPMMTLLSICLTVPARAGASKRLKLKGTVVRKEKDPRTGRVYLAVYFNGLSAADSKLLAAYIERRLDK
jgi:c-di-GMP-binding flagellar brake protein YcgR